MRTGLLGGSFNPPHNGHLAMARAAKETHSLDEVWLLVAARPPHKRAGELADFKARFEMARLAAQELPYLKASDIEARLPGVSYTCRTLEVITRENPGVELHFIMGADTIPELATWKNPERILELAAPVVIPRSGFSARDVERLKDILPAEQLDALKESYLEADAVDISSTAVRERISRGEPFEQYLPSSVADYILRNGLYM
jgi:nicotinate-nucleotide adenylyltransferase